MVSNRFVVSGELVLPERIFSGSLLVERGTIAAIFERESDIPSDVTRIRFGDGVISPGFVDLHVHGGGGGDFMDGTDEAFQAALRTNLKHGTTRLAVTTTVATHEQILQALRLTRYYRQRPLKDGSRVLGAHFYGPYFRLEAKGAHPGQSVRQPIAEEYEEYLSFADDLVTATIAPELEGAEAFALACRERNVRTNVGHSWATFQQMEQAIAWGVRHVDHLFCAMSDRARLRQFQMYPMQGGVLEATLFFDELTTEVIADGKHLDSSLLKLAYKIKGSDRLALVTDCSRALDMPDGEYIIGPLDGGEPILKRDGVGLLPDGKALASSVCGMDQMVITMQRLTGLPIWEVIKMASLTPARIAGREKAIGSLAVGKHADFLFLDRQFQTQAVFIDGEIVYSNSNFANLC